MSVAILLQDDALVPAVAHLRELLAAEQTIGDPDEMAGLSEAERLRLHEKRRAYKSRAAGLSNSMRSASRAQPRVAQEKWLIGTHRELMASLEQGRSAIDVQADDAREREAATRRRAEYDAALTFVRTGAQAIVGYTPKLVVDWFAAKGIMPPPGAAINDVWSTRKFSSLPRLEERLRTEQEALDRAMEKVERELRTPI